MWKLLVIILVVNALVSTGIESISDANKGIFHTFHLLRSNQNEICIFITEIE